MGPQPSFGKTVSQAEPPPPISGGTLAIAPDGVTAVAADPDRDRVYVVDLPSRTLTRTVQLPARSEAGRVAFDRAGRAFVVLRSARAIAAIDLARGVATTHPVCSTPRGIAFDSAASMLRIACASGELLKVTTSGEVVERREVGPDLRDVIVMNDGRVQVSRFRTGERLTVDPAGSVLVDVGPPMAWRTVAARAEDPGCSTCEPTTATVSQEPAPVVATTPSGEYYSASAAPAPDPECALSGIVTTRLRIGRMSALLPAAVLPVDLATNGREYVVVAAGNALTHTLPQLFVVREAELAAVSGGCTPTNNGNVPGQAIAAAFAGDDRLVVLTREPAAIHLMTDDRQRPWKTIRLADDSREDTGHAIFHANAGGFIACASCHAEGADDGHVWTFSGIGERRTPSLRGTIEHTAPYHCNGELADMRALADTIFATRMSGPKMDDAQVEALRKWIVALPPLPKLREPSVATKRGETIFRERCTSCHAGEALTNNESVAVGTGGAFQVPSLVGVAWRPPFLHTGCAKTLAARFAPECGGGSHGDSGLRPDEIVELVAYLETL